MKRLINIFYVFFLISVLVVLTQNTATAGRKASSNEASGSYKGIIKQIEPGKIKIGSKEYLISGNIKCYASNGNITSLDQFHKRDGVSYKLTSKGKIYYLKKIPR